MYFPQHPIYWFFDITECCHGNWNTIYFKNNHWYPYFYFIFFHTNEFIFPWEKYLKIYKTRCIDWTLVSILKLFHSIGTWAPLLLIQYIYTVLCNYIKAKHKIKVHNFERNGTTLFLQCAIPSAVLCGNSVSLLSMCHTSSAARTYQLSCISWGI